MSLSIAQFDMPFPYKKNPHYAALAPDMSQEMVDRGLIEADQFEYHVGFNLLNGFFFPYAKPDVLRTAARMIDLFFLADDVYDTNAANGRNTSLIAKMLQRVVHALKTRRLPDDPDALCVLAFDTVDEMSHLVPNFQIERMVNSIHDYLLTGSLVLMSMWHDRYMPDISEYINVRQFDVAGYPTIDVAEFAAEITLSPEVYGHRHLQAMRRACCLNIAMTNDVLSYQKEVIRDGCPYNAVNVVHCQRQGSVEDAILEVIDIANQFMRRFLALKSSLPTWGVESDRDVARYVQAMEDLMAGNYYWSFECTRYSSADSPFIELQTTSALLTDKSRGHLVSYLPRGLDTSLQST